MRLGLLFGHEVSLMLKLFCLGYGTLAHYWSCLWCSTLSHHWSYRWWGTPCHHWFCLWWGTPTLPLVLSIIRLPPLIVGPVWDVVPPLTVGPVCDDVVPPLTARPVRDVSVLSGIGYPVTIAPVCDMGIPSHSQFCLGCSTIGSVWYVCSLTI